MTTPTRDELLIDGDLIYTLRNGENYTEIRVTMADGSSDMGARSSLARETLSLLCAHQAQAEPDYKRMFGSVVSALGAIDHELGIGDDGCGSPDDTLQCIKELVGRVAQADQTWNEAIETAAKILECGLFLHDNAPDARLAKSAAKIIRTLARPSQAQEPSKQDHLQALADQAQALDMGYGKPVSGAVDERAAFESHFQQWAEKHHRSFTRARDGMYADYRVRARWLGWEACLANLSPAQQAPAVSEFPRLSFYQGLLEWNRKQDDSPIKIPREYGVAEAALDILLKECGITNSNQITQPAAAPVSEQTAQPVERQELSDEEIERIDDEVMRQPQRRGYCVRFARAIIAADRGQG